MRRTGNTASVQPFPAYAHMEKARRSPMRPVLGMLEFRQRLDWSLRDSRSLGRWGRHKTRSLVP